MERVTQITGILPFMLLDPLNSITSVTFYRKVAQRPAARAMVYVCYLGLIFTLAAVLAMKFRVVPHIDETFTWLAESVPPITFANGKITTPARGPVLVRHPKIADVAFIIDTKRTEPVTARLLEKENVVAFLTADALYLRSGPGKVQVHDFSTAENPKPVVIDADFFHNTAKAVPFILYPMVLLITFPLFIVWKAIASMLYTVMALMINAIVNGGLEFPTLFSISVHAQTTVILLQTIFLFTNRPPGFPLIALLVTGTYIFLAIKTVRDAPAPPETSASPPTSPPPPAQQ